MIRKEYKYTFQNFIEFMDSCPVDYENILLLDIETTGLSRVNNHIYIIGIGRVFESSDSKITLSISQFFSESNDDEYTLLMTFTSLLRSNDTIITFNGNRFDIPFLNARLKKYGLQEIDKESTVDLYKIAKSMSGLISLPNYRQKTVESYLGIHRDDQFSGLELINVYKNYIKHPNNDGLNALLLHNMEDVKGMLDLFVLFSYKRKYDNYLDDLVITIDNCNQNDYKSYDGKDMKEYLITFRTNNTFPVSLSINNQNLFFRLNNDNGRVSLKLYKGELCHYITDYKNYYYLPLEDTVIHRDLALFVDKDHRIKATADNCKIKKDSFFIPVFSSELTSGNKKLPVFKENPKSKDLYIEFNDEIMNDNQFLSDYIRSILFVLCKEK